MTYGYGMYADVWRRCKGVTQSGQRCKRTELGSAQWPFYCWQHASQRDAEARP